MINFSVCTRYGIYQRFYIEYRDIYLSAAVSLVLRDWEESSSAVRVLERSTGILPYPGRFTFVFICTLYRPPTYPGFIIIIIIIISLIPSLYPGYLPLITPCTPDIYLLYLVPRIFTPYNPLYPGYLPRIPPLYPGLSQYGDLS